MAIQINRPCVVFTSFGIEPVAVNQVTVRIEIPEKAVGDSDLPCVVLYLLPALDNFGALDDDFIAGCGLVNDALLIGLPATRRINPLAIGSLMHCYEVAGLCNFRRPGNSLKRCFGCPFVRIITFNRNMILPRLYGTGQ